MIYMDEAGIAHSSQEPYLVVAAAITDPDIHWRRMRDYYNEMAADLLPEREEFENYVFHAKDVWHGSGDFDRKRWPLKERMKILRRLAQAPAMLSVPICLGMIDKAKIENKGSDKNHRILCHAFAYHFALQQADYWMAQNCPTEVAMVTVEDTQEVHEFLIAVHSSAQWAEAAADYLEYHEIFQTRTIVDSVKFAKKDQSPVLQIADTCAFIARRMLNGCQHSRPFFDLFRRQLVRGPSKMRQVQLLIPISHLAVPSDEKP